MIDWSMLGLGGASAGLSFAGMAYGSNMSYKRQQNLMRLQAQLNYDYGLKYLQNSPSSQRTGLESAGYNPMLAVQNGTSGANSNFSAQSTSGEPDYSSALSSGFSNALQYGNLLNQTRQTDSNVMLNEAQARTATQEAIEKEIHNQYLPDKEKAELGKIGAETDKLIRETSFYNQLADNMEAERRLQELGIYVSADTQRYSADKAYNASTYASNRAYDSSIYGYDKSYHSNIYGNRLSHPYWSWLHKAYTSGKDYSGSYSDPWSK